MQCSITPPLTPMPPTLKKSTTPSNLPWQRFYEEERGDGVQSVSAQLATSALQSSMGEKTREKRGEGDALILAAIPYRPLDSLPVSFRTFQPRSDSVHRLVFSIAKITPSSVTSGINFKQQSHSIFLGMCNMPRVAYCVTPFIMVVLFLYSTGSHRHNTIRMLLSRLMH